MISEPLATQLINSINAHLEKTDQELTPASKNRSLNDLQLLSDTAKFFPKNFNLMVKYLQFTLKKKEVIKKPYVKSIYRVLSARRTAPLYNPLTKKFYSKGK